MQHPQSTFKTRRGLFPLIASLFTLFFLFTLAGPASAIPTTPRTAIDPFDSGYTEVRVTNPNAPGVSYDHVSTTSALGESRKVRAEATVSTNGVIVEVGGAANLNYLDVNSAPSGQWILDVIWDGTDPATANWQGDPEDIDYTGLYDNGVGIDLVKANTADEADGIYFYIVGWEGNDIDIIFTVYTDENNWSQGIYPVRGEREIGPYEASLCFFEGCFDADQGLNGPANFENVGAITMRMISIEAGADIRINMIASGPSRDFGDLPDSYSTTLDEDGPRHSRGNLFLGETVSSELDAREPLDSTGDGATDDGIVPVGTVDGRWVNGSNGGTVEVAWTSPFNDGRACLDGWIDWHYGVATSGTPNSFETTTGPVPGGGTATYALADKHVVQGHLLSGSGALPFTETVTFTVPDNYFAATGGDPIDLASRWRIYPAEIDQLGNPFCPNGGLGVDGYTGYIINGEVEDYIWGFQPTSVALIGFQASTVALPWVVGVLVLTLLTGLLLVVRRRQTVTA